MLRSAALGRDRDHIQKPLDGRTLVQTSKAVLPAEVLLEGKPQCHQDADQLRNDGPAADGGDQEKTETRKLFANMITVIRLHLISYLSLMELIMDIYKEWQKTFDMQVAFSP
jgi:hypothetical protein